MPSNTVTNTFTDTVAVAIKIIKLFNKQFSSYTNVNLNNISHKSSYQFSFANSVTNPSFKINIAISGLDDTYINQFTFSLQAPKMDVDTFYNSAYQALIDYQFLPIIDNDNQYKNCAIDFFKGDPKNNALTIAINQIIPPSY